MSCSRRWIGSLGSIGRQYHLFDYVGCARRREGGRDPRLGRRRGGGSGPDARRPRREGGADQGSTVSSVLRRSVHRGTAAHDPGHRRPGPHQGAGKSGRAALPRRRDRPGRELGQPGQGSGADPASHRRPVRPLVEGIHAGHGRGGLRRARLGTIPSRTSRWGSTTM